MSKRWVKNNPDAPAQQRKPKAPDTPHDLFSPQGNMPPLFAAPAPAPAPKATAPRAPRKKKEAPDAPLFGFDFTASLPKPTIEAPKAPLKSTVAAAEHAAANWHNVTDPAKWRDRLQKVISGDYRLGHGDASTLLPGDHDLQSSAKRVQKEFAAELLKRLPANDAPDAPAPLLVPATTPAPTTLTPRVAADGSKTLSQEEYRALNAGALMVGSTKQEDGHTYRLNANHRWERADPDPAAAADQAWAAFDAVTGNRRTVRESADRHKEAFNATAAAAASVPVYAQPVQEGDVFHMTRSKGKPVTAHADGTLTSGEYHFEPVQGEPGHYRCQTWGDGRGKFDNSEWLYPYFKLGEDRVLRRITPDTEGRTLTPPTPTAPTTAPTAQEPDPSIPRVTQAEFDRDRDRYDIDMETGQPTGTRWEDGRGTVLGPVHIEDRTRPLSIRVRSGHAALRPSNRPGVLSVDGAKGVTVQQDENGQWTMYTGPGSTHIKLAEESPGVLVVARALGLRAPDPEPTPEPASPPAAEQAPDSAPSDAPDAPDSAEPDSLERYVEKQLAGKSPAQLREIASLKQYSDEYEDRAKRTAARDPNGKHAKSDTAKAAHLSRHLGMLAAVVKEARTRLGWNPDQHFQPRAGAADYSQPATPEWFSRLPKFGFELLSKSTPARRVAANKEAIALSERLTEEGRAPTPDERAILARYTGDGGTNGDLNAHYTPTQLAGAMWRLLHRAGFKDGAVLEPSMGAGVFFETAPAGAQMHGVELSPVTQKVSALLHAGDTVNDPQPFERYHTNNPEVTFAASISNPPYGSRGQVYGELDKPEIHEAERYFMDTVLDKLEDGGLSVSLTNPGPFESADGRAFRARLAARADVLGVYQLPQSVFGDSESGVPPVILVMRKRPHAVGMTLAKMVEQHGEDVLEKAGVFDPAFAEGTLHLQPENLFGTFTGKTLFRGYKDIQGAADPELLSRLAEANLKPPADLTAADLDERLSEYGMQELDKARTRAAAYGVAKEGEINGDRIYSQGRWRTLTDAAPELADATAVSRVLQQLANVKNNGQIGDAEMVRQDAHKRVQEFLDTHGNPHKMKSVRAAAKHHHALANLLTAVTREGDIARHVTTPLKDDDTGADLVDKTDLHAVATHLHARGRLTPEHVARVWEGAGGDRATAEDAMLDHPEIALTEDGQYVPAAAYYHGNVFDRAASLDAQSDREDRTEYKEKYRQQAERFRSILPRTSLENIEVTPRDKWLPPHVVEAYINEVVEPDAQVAVTQHAGVFYVHGPKTPALDEIRQYLNYAQTPDAVRGQDNKSKNDIAAERAANLIALQDRIKHIEGSFSGWLSGHEHRDTAEEAYNRSFNSHLPETLSTEPLSSEKDGWTGPKLHDFQRQDVRFMLRQGGGITALDVGLGKTYTGAALLDELQRNGKAKKPMVVVPRSLLPNWRQTFGKAHEDANIISHPDEDAQHGRRVLIIGQTYKGKKKNKLTGEMEDHWSDDSGDEVAQKLVRAAHENWHAIVITRDWHSKIPLRPETWGRMVETDIQKQRNIELDEADDDDRAMTGKRKGSRKESLRDQEAKRAEALVKAARKLFKNHANPLHWEDLGVDALLCDEAHAYKNLYAAPPALGSESPKYMGAGGESKRAQDFNYKARHLREKNGGHGVYFLTATPTKNSPLEVFNMLSHVTDALGRRGIGLTDDFVSRYCKIETRSVPALDGTYESKACVVGFKNLGELRGLISQHVFRRTKDSEDVKALPGWHVPERDDIEHEFEMEPSVESAYKDLAESARAASQSMGGFDESGRHVFSYLADMRKMTLDPGLMGYDTGNNPRFKKAAEIAMNAHKEGGKTVMFMDLGKQREVNDEGSDSRSESEINDAAVEYNIPGAADMKPAERKKAVVAYENSMQQNAYDRLVEHLVKQGIPRERIAVVTGETAKNTQTRQDIKDQFNNGQLSVVIGSTPVIGEGFSLQRGTTDMVHLDTPWDPGTYQQRLGRAQRQGNKLATVRNHVLLAKDSFDAVTYSTMLGKQGWMQQLWDGTEDAADNSEASGSNLEDIAAMLDSDPAKYKELAEQRKREAEERQKVAVRQRTVEGVRRYARQINAVHQNAKDYAQMEQEVEMLERQLPHAPETKRDAVREGIARKRGQLVRAAARKDKIAREAASARRVLGEDPNLQDRHRAVIESGLPFLMDAQGGCYATGGVFTDGQGRQRRITEVDTKAATIKHRPLIPQSTPGHWIDQTVTEDASGIQGATDHEIVRSEDTERAMLTHVLHENNNLSVLRRLHPDLVSRHADFIQRHLKEKADQLRNSYGGVWSVGPDGKAHYTKPPTGSRSTLTPLSLPAGHRYLLNTPEDMPLLERALQHPDLDNDYRAAADAPSHNEGDYDRISRVTTYKVKPASSYTGSHIVKADQGATDTFTSLLASMQASKRGKVRA
ncbi:DEAD/DEAH box helicase [Deinococcus sp. UR1]|uniref:DEAD/DEAH box helicase n=1 Tax=Deinococcus sp. UR1 TaxID=1704277 RepID=UPI0011AF898E|nr:DEAD/DEAH box helicase [Deinococcus sp. UR1]